MKIKVIGFDLDGTLYRQTPEIHNRIRNKIYEKISALCNIPHETAKRLFLEHYAKLSSGTKSIEKITENYKIKINNKDIVQEAMEEANILDLIKPNPKLYKILEELSQRKYLDIITGSTKNSTLEKLSRIGIPPLIFSHILTSEDSSKTTGEKYQKWINTREFKPQQHLYIGDNKKQDIDSPNSLGIQTCFIGEYKNADFQIQNILELEKLVSTI